MESYSLKAIFSADSQGFVNGISGIMGAMANAEAKVGGFQGALGNVFNKVSKPLTIAGAAFSAVGGLAVSSFKEVKAGEDILIKATGATGDEAKKLKDVYNDLGDEVTGSWEQIAATVAQTSVRFGASGEALKGLSKEFQMFANITNQDGKEAVTNVSQAMRYFSLETDDMATNTKTAKNIMGLFAATAQKTGRSAQSLQEGINSAGPTLKELGFGLGQSVQLMAAFDAAGVDGASALQQWRVAAKKAATDGFDLKDKIQQLATTLGSTAKDTQEHADAAKEAGELLGRGAAGFITLAEEGKINLENLSDDLEQYGDVVEKTAKETLDGPKRMANAWKGVQSALKPLGEEIMNILSPIVEKIGAIIKAIAGKFKDLPEGMKKFLVIGGLLTAAFAGVAALLPIFSAIGGAIAAISAPVLIVVGVIGLLVAAFVSLYKKSEAVRNAVSDAWNGIKETVSGAWNAIKDTFAKSDFSEKLGAVWNKIKDTVSVAFEAIKGVVKAGIDVITDFWNRHGETISNFVGNILSILGGVFSTVIGIISGAFETIKGIFEVFSGLLRGDWETVWNGIKDVLDGIWNVIKSLVGGAIDFVWGIIKSGLDLIKDTWNSSWNALKDFLGGIWGGIKDTVSKIASTIKDGINKAVNFIKELPGKAFSWGADFINGLAGGIKSAIGGVIDSVKGMASKIKEFLHFSRPDKGPLRGYESWMPDFMKGLAKGISANTHLVTDEMNDLSEQMTVTPKVNELEIDSRSFFSVIDTMQKTLETKVETFKSVGREIGHNVAKGIESTESLVRKASEFIVSIPTLDDFNVGGTVSMRMNDTSFSHLAEDIAQALDTRPLVVKADVTMDSYKVGELTTDSVTKTQAYNEKLSNFRQGIKYV